AVLGGATVVGTAGRAVGSATGPGACPSMRLAVTAAAVTPIAVAGSASQRARGRTAFLPAPPTARDRARCSAPGGGWSRPDRKSRSSSSISFMSLSRRSAERGAHAGAGPVQCGLDRAERHPHNIGDLGVGELGYGEE